MRKILVHAPATVANLVCGFDILGLALNNPSDKMVLSTSANKGVTIINKDEFNLPVIPTMNVAGAALLAMLEHVDEEVGFVIESSKAIKPGSGIGSSAASAVAAVTGANELLNKRFTKEQLVEFAMYGELVASGVKHADNIAPCIYGGITLIRSNTPLDIISLDFPDMYVTILHPQIEIKTSDSRAILRKQVTLKDSVTQAGNVSALVAGLMKRDYEIISRALVDVIVEPVRSILIPCYAEVKNASIKTGALGGGISGSGPSMFMLSKDMAAAKRVEFEMHQVYSAVGIDFKTYVSSINRVGARFEEIIIN